MNRQGLIQQLSLQMYNHGKATFPNTARRPRRVLSARLFSSQRTLSKSPSRRSSTSRSGQLTRKSGLISGRKAESHVSRQACRNEFFERASRKNDERGSEFFFRHVSGKGVWIGGAAKFQPSLRALKKTKAVPGEEIRGNALVLRVALPRRSAQKCCVNQQGAAR